jgi:hypothetical protein
VLGKTIFIHYQISGKMTFEYKSKENEEGIIVETGE